MNYYDVNRLSDVQLAKSCKDYIEDEANKVKSCEYIDMILDISTKFAQNDWTMSHKQKDILIGYYTRNIWRLPKPTKKMINEAREKLAEEEVRQMVKDEINRIIDEKKFYENLSGEELKKVDIGSIVESIF
jgi:hypothetical protein